MLGFGRSPKARLLMPFLEFCDFRSVSGEGAANTLIYQAIRECIAPSQNRPTECILCTSVYFQILRHVAHDVAEHRNTLGNHPVDYDCILICHPCRSVFCGHLAGHRNGNPAMSLVVSFPSFRLIFPSYMTRISGPMI